MDFYDRVNALCRERGISITALAIELGFSKGTPSNWKRMTKPPRAENVKKIADYFGIPVEYLYDTDPAAQVPPAPEAQKEKPTVQDDELSDKRKALIDVAVNATGDTLDLLLRVAQSITGSN